MLTIIYTSQLATRFYCGCLYPRNDPIYCVSPYSYLCLIFQQQTNMRGHKEKKYGKEYCSICFELVDNDAAKALHIMIKHMPPLFASKICHFKAHMSGEIVEHFKEDHPNQLQCIHALVEDASADYEQEFQKAYFRSFGATPSSNVENPTSTLDDETEVRKHLTNYRFISVTFFIVSHSCLLLTELARCFQTLSRIETFTFTLERSNPISHFSASHRSLLLTMFGML